MKSVKDNWNADLYDTKHAFISNYGNDLIGLLGAKKEEKILDLGCGTGDLAKKLHDIGVDVIGVDQSANMVSEALKKYPDVQFSVEDATSLGYDNEFDAVFSNATLHWIKQPKQVLNCVYKSLKDGGRFVAEFGGKDNVLTITKEIIHQWQEAGFDFNDKQFPWYFPSIGEYATLMEESGFAVTFMQHFERPTPLNGDDGLRNWIKMFCGTMFGHSTEEETDPIITKVENNLKNVLYKDGNWIADYKRIRVIGVKKQ